MTQIEFRTIEGNRQVLSPDTREIAVSDWLLQKLEPNKMQCSSEQKIEAENIEKIESQEMKIVKKVPKAAI